MTNNLNISLNLIKKSFQAHPFHLVAQSPWPISISWTLFFSAIGAVLAMQGYGATLLSLGLFLTVWVMFFWFEDVAVEGTLNGNHTKQVKKGLILGFYLFLISEVFAFISVFWAYFHSSLVPAVELGAIWPPLGITPLDPFAIPLLNTFLLVSSGAFVTFGHHALIAGKRHEALVSVFLTVVLAVVFTALQYYEYTESGFTIADSVFGSTFYASTGLHGFHVIIGTIFICVGLIRLFKYTITRHTHLGLETSILYWHFVDIVWLFLYIAVYYWGSNS